MSRLQGNGSLVACVAMTVLPFLAGCGGEEFEKLPTFPVTAVVRMDGEAFGPCSVMLHPVSEGRSVVGPTDAQGNVSFGTYENGDGAPAGEYKVVVQGTLSAAPPKPIPPTYSNPAKTPLRATITEGNNEIAFDLDSKGAKSSGTAGGGDPFTRATQSDAFGAGASQE